jgi:hypothetical protein
MKPNLFFVDGFSQPFSSLLPPPFKYIPSAGGFHAGAKSVFTFCLDFTGLKGPLHEFTSYLFKFLNYLDRSGENIFNFNRQREKKFIIKTDIYTSSEKKSCQVLLKSSRTASRLRNIFEKKSKNETGVLKRV